MNDHRRQAAALARRISLHHQACRACQRPGRKRRCRRERALFAALAREQEAGWPAGS